ncbi:MAG: NAD(P)-dependent alcohol dehydrogenase [Clostridia bacterium]|nr:NAD(P)-dependent alcohol dehydrogenase [Clostridia bacterium]
MKAVVYEKKNRPDSLIYREVDKPEPDDDQVLVKIMATSLNAADYRSMKMGIIPKNKIFGADIAGQVEKTGKNITKFHVGDDVVGEIASCDFGGLAEYVAVPESYLALKPKELSFEMTAAVPMAAMTALQALRNKGKLTQGQRVLIVGAGGGVGTFAVQLAKYFGAEVTAVCGEKNVEMVLSLGADHVIDYAKSSFEKSDKQYHLILAVNGNYSLSSYRRSLVKGGILVAVGGALTQILKVMIFGKILSIGSKKMCVLAAKANTEDLEWLMKHVEEGTITPVIDRTYPLNETAQAFRYLNEGHAKGKVIIVIGKD